MHHVTTVRRALVAAVAAALAVASILLGSGGARAATAPHSLPPFPAYRVIHFPVLEESQVWYTDTFGACRGVNCSRHHQGEDLIGVRLLHELAAVDGTVTWMRQDAGGTGGNWLVITDAQGWTYQYGHINNDTPGTDDGANPAQWRFAPGLHVGSVVKAGQFVAYMGDSGDAENSVPHLHFEIRTPQDVAIDEYPSLRLSQHLPVSSDYCGVPTNPPTAPQAVASARGYWLVEANGAVHAFGAAPMLGDASALQLWAPVLNLAATPDRKGYWLTARDGGIFSYGSARFYGSTGGIKLVAPVTGMVPTKTGKGYWLFADDGGIFSFGDASFFGSAAGNLAPGARVTSVARTPSGQGYWIVASDGSVLPFGDAAAVQPTGSMHSAVVTIAPTPTGKGYWIGSAVGGVAAAGDAAFVGDPLHAGLCAHQQVALVPSATGEGYFSALADGTVITFGDAKWYGDARGTATVVAMTAFV